jgi:pyruvate/2-oxoglutarate dehydrogenase complex dihydrolipoamide acyltransferase (E2) component
MRDRAQRGYEVVPFPPRQHQAIDWNELMCRQHTFHVLLEVDVTEARRAIREQRRRTGKPLSLTAFVLACFARALAEDPGLNAYRRRRRLVRFADVDVTTLVERDVQESQLPIPFIVRAANRKSLLEIEREIRSAREGRRTAEPLERLLPLWLVLPPVLRRLVWRRLLASPLRRRRLTGTATLTAAGMFGRGGGWGIPFSSHTTCLAVGGIARRAQVVAGEDGRRVETRRLLALTLSFDHDVVNGAPAARFASRLAELIEAPSIV